MISQRCPICRSTRIRRGYRPTPFWEKILFRYNLLCDNCNWEFIGFALPGFISTRQTKSSRERKEKGDFARHEASNLVNTDNQRNPEVDLTKKTKQKVKKKIKVRI